MTGGSTMQVGAFTIEGFPFRPLLEQIFSRILLRSPDPGTRRTGAILLALSTGELVSLALLDLQRTSMGARPA